MARDRGVLEDEANGECPEAGVWGSGIVTSLLAVVLGLLSHHSRRSLTRVCPLSGILLHRKIKGLHRFPDFVVGLTLTP